MRLFFLGDMVGKTGRTAVWEQLPGLISDFKLDFVLGIPRCVGHSERSQAGKWDTDFPEVSDGVFGADGREWLEGK